MMGFSLGDLRMFVGGKWVDSLSGERFHVMSPATGQIVGSIPHGTREDAREAIAAARAAQHLWARTPLPERARICRRIAEVVLERREGLAHLLTLEQGKPYHTEALSEVDSTALRFQRAGEHAMGLDSLTPPIENPAKRVIILRQPRGVYAVITPWNFPLSIPSEYLSAALVTGNVLVWVPAPTTSACAVRLVESFEEAGVPPGVVNLVTGPGPIVGDEIVAHPDTDAIAFTGSTATGVTIAARAAGKPLLLELGGNGPTVVFPDGDLTRAAPAIAANCFRNAGQVCSATGRILVHRSVQKELAQHLVDAAMRIRLGDPFDPQTTMGPLNNERTAHKVDQHLADARERGGNVLFGGGRVPGFPTDLYYLPTVVEDVPPDSRLHLEETFGPVAALIPFEDEEEALRYADASQLGLTGAIFTRDIAKGLRVADQLRIGVVVINDHSSYWDRRSPAGGASGKRSGIGRQGGKNTLAEMTDLKTIFIDVT